MKKYFIFFAFIFIMGRSFSQTCVTTYSTVNITVDCHSFPYSYDGTFYNYWGLYTINLINSKGCDSIVTLSLDAPTIGRSITNVTICATQTPYSWGLEEYSVSGSYDNDINIYGCNPENPEDSIATLNLTVLPADTVVSYDTLCGAQLPYYNPWIGQAIYASGTYTGPIANSGHGKCGTIGELIVTVVDPPQESSTYVTVCSSQLPYSWNGKSLTTGGSYYASIVTHNPCDSIADLYLTVNNNPTSVTNVTICADKVPYTWNGKSYSTTGIDTAIITHAGCDSLAILNLTVKQLATLTSFAPATATKGQAVVITGTNFSDVSAVNFGGNPASSFTIESPTNIIATVGTAVSGAVSVTTGCNTISLAGFSFNNMPGNIGIGTGAATSKLTVNGGDFQVSDIGSGIILKSPDGSCWRITIDNDGNLIRTKIPCP